jgi:hypothetical protein
MKQKTLPDERPSAAAELQFLEVKLSALESELRAVRLGRDLLHEALREERQAAGHEGSLGGDWREEQAFERQRLMAIASAQGGGR